MTFSFDGRGATTVRPRHKPAASPGNWARDESAPGEADGTQITASLINAIAANLRRLCDASGEAMLEGADDNLLRAVRRIMSDAVGGLGGFRGTHADLAALQAAHPAAASGDWAILSHGALGATIALWDPDPAPGWIDTALNVPGCDVTVSRDGMSVTVQSSSGTDGAIPAVDDTQAGVMTAADKAKLDGIEAGAAADQSGAEVKAAYEAEADTNAFTDAEAAKLAGVETGATADQTGAEIKAAYEAEADTNAFTDAEAAKLAGIEAGATGDMTGAQIKAAYEAEADTNAFTDADMAKLAGIEAGATADMTGAEIKTAYEAEADTNAFSDADVAKLAGIEAGATNGLGTKAWARRAAVREWKVRTSAVDNAWSAIAWSPELKLFAAVARTGTGNRVMTSPDGINWTLRASAADNDWLGIAWSPELGLFAAVATTGTGNRVMTSPDGITWTSRASAANSDWSAIAAGAASWAPEQALFFAIASSSSMYSSDGINWFQAPPPPASGLRGIAWSPALGVFVMVGGATVVIFDPESFVQGTAPAAADNAWNAVAWSPELALFAAVAASGTGNRAMTSPDGINWTLRATPADHDWSAIAWSPELGLFVAVAETGTGNRVMTSADGIDWRLAATPADNAWNGIAWSSELGLFAAVAASGAGDRAMTSR